LKARTTLIGIAISLLLLFLALRNVDFGYVLSMLRGIHIFSLTIPLVFIFVGLFLRVLRWKYILNPSKKEKLLNLFSVMMISYLGNNILPARMGEVLRIYTLDKNYGFNKSQTLGTIVVEKIFDVLVLLTFFAITLFFASFPAWVKNSGLLLGVGLFAIIAFLKFSLNNKPQTFRLIKILISPFSERIGNKTKGILENFGNGLSILQKKKDLVIVMSYSIVIWIVEFLFVDSILSSLGLRLTIVAPVFLTVMLNIGMLIPSSPGYIGTYQAACIASLAPFGIEKNLALSVSIVLHVLMLITTTVTGMICFWKEKTADLAAFSNACGESDFTHSLRR